MTEPLFPLPDAEVVRVAHPVPSDELFEYSLPPALAPGARPGCRVQAPLRGRVLTGVIVERGARTLAAPLLPIQALVDAEPVLSEAMLRILREAAEEILCPPGIALAAALPAGSAPRVSAGLGLSARGRAALEAGGLPAATREALELLAPGPRATAELRRRLGARCLDELQRDGLLAGQRVERRPAARAATRRVASVPAGLDVDRACSSALARAPRQAELLRSLARRGPTALPDLAAALPGATRGLRELVRRGLAQVEERAAPRDVLGAPPRPERAVSLTPEQSEALGPIAEAVRSRAAETFLLHGVTGSGKTEVYLRAIAEALRLGRQALVLVPEITLTHQIVARLRARFGDALAVLHSGLRPGERLEQWQRLRAGQTPIAAGARSALFAPLDDLGVIVIDEEHDTAYKNEEGFRYHARDLARLRAGSAGCPLVLGSATPSLETRAAADRGQLRRLVLPSRIGGRPLPAVEIADLQQERDLTARGHKLVFSRTLARALRENLREGGQTILLLNRRGFSTQIFCFACGHAEHCPDCDIALVYHAADQQLRCHYCDHQRPPPERCAGCGAAEVALLGIGTQRLEEEVRQVLPDARVARLDRDTAQRRGHAREVLEALRDGELDVLIGTQMVAKGHDFPGVRLVGVVLADVGLHLPDFRAAERTFQLLTQVAGRAGRDLAPGRVVVQTWSPQHYAVRLVKEHDYEAFYAEEMGYRAALGYPPAGHLAHALVSAPQEADAQRAAARLAEAAAPAPGVELLGPAPAPLARLRGRHRVQLLLKSASPDALRAAARRVRDAAAQLPEGVQAHVDLRPVNML
jgi:primosomal protein N' (replication factor Y)